MAIMDKSILALTVLALFGCAAEAERTEAAAQATEPLFVASKKIWPRDPNTGRVPMSVCWATPGYDTEKAWIRKAIQYSWEQKSLLQTSWHECVGAEPNSLHIALRDTRPYTTTLGIDNRGLAEGVVLNPSFANTDPSCKGGDRQFCIQAIAIHEFGHVLGFDHEDLRPDTQCHDASDTSDVTADTTVGGWDLYSIMNYCNPLWNNKGRLSWGDETGLNQYYGLAWVIDHAPNYYFGFETPTEGPRAYAYGGQYQKDDCGSASDNGGTAGNDVPNPATGGTTCPSGYSEVLAARVRTPETRCGANQYICVAQFPFMYMSFDYQGTYQVDDCGRNSSNNPWTQAQSCPSGSHAVRVGRIHAPESRCGATQYLCTSEEWTIAAMPFYGSFVVGDGAGRNVNNQFTNSTTCPTGSYAQAVARTRQGDAGWGQVMSVCKPAPWGTDFGNLPSNLVGCRGDGLAVCREKVNGYDLYFYNHPACYPNPGNCAGQYSDCSVDCPRPSENDKTLQFPLVGCRGNEHAVCREKVAGYDLYFVNHPKCTLNPGNCAGTYGTCSYDCPPPSPADTTAPY